MTIRGLVFCACIWGVAVPAVAEERGAAAPTPRALPTFSTDAPKRVPAFGAAVPVRLPGALPKRASAAAPASMDFAVTLRTAAPVGILEGATLGAQAETSPVRAMAAWRVTDRDPLINGTTTGTSVVRDQMADYRKPRGFRPSALSAMLTLKIDGNTDSEPFSVGGGALASVLWRATSQ